MDKTAKRQLIDSIERLPDDATIDELLTRIHHTASILRGLEEARRGEGITQEELKSRLREWRTSSGRRRLAD